MQVNFHIDTIDQIATKILEYSDNIKIFCFDGNLGAGKTTLINSICKRLNPTISSSSPTFSIVNEYNLTNDSSIYHLDLYRLIDSNELINISFDDIVFSNKYCFIEWYQIAEKFIPKPYIKISISFVDQHTRSIELNKII